MVAYNGVIALMALLSNQLKFKVKRETERERERVREREREKKISWGRIFLEQDKFQT